jgi:TetR/AcrR family transcriptional regulator, tetracycline repressor protein
MVRDTIREVAVALTQEQVVRGAVDLLAKAGLEALTLRALATELGVSAPTLYWHVRNKRQLLDLMAEALVRRAGRSPSPAHGQPWWDWLAEQARVQWRVLTSHRDAALVVAGNRPTETALPEVEETVASLVAVGFPPAEALRTLLAIGNYVLGCAVELQAEAAREPDPERDARLLRELREAEDLPNLQAAMPGMASSDPGASFEHGLGLLIAGIRARHAELVEATAAAGAPAEPG